MTKFEIDRLDHVALRVSNPEASANWYTKVFGLKRYQLPEWGAFPIFLLAGTTGIALFPANTHDQPLPPHSKNVGIDHFAFRVNRENFENAQKRFEEIGIEYQFQDHFYFHSIYTQDPDGHTVELTTLVGDEGEFYDMGEDNSR